MIEATQRISEEDKLMASLVDGGCTLLKTIVTKYPSFREEVLTIVSTVVKIMIASFPNERVIRTKSILTLGLMYQQLGMPREADVCERSAREERAFITKSNAYTVIVVLANYVEELRETY